MKSYSRSHLSDGTLLSETRTHLSQDRIATAELLADLAEIDHRRLYAPAGYSSMHAYCTGELHLSEDSACRRIGAARTARKFPAIFTAVADGRLHLTGVVQLAPYLSPENAGELLVAAALKSKAEIDLLLASRFPRSDVPALVRAIPSPSPTQLLNTPCLAPRSDQSSAPARIASAEPRPGISPLAPQRFAMQLTIGQSAHDKLRYAQQLLGHRVPSGDLAEVLEHLLDLAIPQLEKRKFSATSRPRRLPRTASSPRVIPARVKRAVWRRDRGQCTFVSEKGRRCDARGRLEYDHIEPVARGGRSTVGNIRLLCRAHNQHHAERVYGSGFMKTKREDAADCRTRALATKAVDEVVPYLRALGCNAREARQAAEACRAISHAALEERVRLAVSQLGPRGFVPKVGAKRVESRGVGQSP